MEPKPLPRPSETAEAAGRELARLVEVMAVLRGEGGCPWDRTQTWASLRRYVLEEAYELVEAVDRGDSGAVREECGDVLLEVVFMARIAEEAGAFGMTEVTRGIREKLVRRHPHVFGAAAPARDAEEALTSWEAVKAQEKKPRATLTGGLPERLPALLVVGKVLERLGAAGRATARRSADRVRAAMEQMERCREGNPEAAEQALGELLFAAAAWAFWEGLDPEAALRGAVRRLAGSDPAEGS